MNTYILIAVYVAIFALLYFVMIRPSSKRKKAEQALRDNIEIGDDITTIGGIQGRIIAIKEDEEAFVIETGPDRTKMKFKKWAISSVDTVKDTPVQTKEDKLKELREQREARKAAKQAAKEEKANKKYSDD